MTKIILGKKIKSLREVVNVKGVNTPINSMVVINSASNTTFTATQLLSGHIFRSGFSTDITDTIGGSAAEIVSAIPNCKIGDQFTTIIYSQPSNTLTSGSITHTLNVGTSISNRMNITNVVYSPTIGSHLVTYKIVVTNVTSPSVVLHRISSVTQVAGSY